MMVGGKGVRSGRRSSIVDGGFLMSMRGVVFSAVV